MVSGVFDKLYENPEAGFVVVMATFPLLERFVRRKSGMSADERKPTSKFYRELGRVFPILTLHSPEDFWRIFRHGLLHQVSFNHSKDNIKLPGGGLSENNGNGIWINAAGEYWVNPFVFARQVIAAIEADFPTFDGTAPKFPTVQTGTGTSAWDDALPSVPPPKFTP